MAMPQITTIFRCEKCRCVFDIGEPVDEKISESIVRKKGFKMLQHWL
jgi:Fe2+ or Zn2+ uptake regulation protein